MLLGSLGILLRAVPFRRDRHKYSHISAEMTTQHVRRKSLIFRQCTIPSARCSYGNTWCHMPLIWLHCLFYTMVTIYTAVIHSWESRKCSCRTVQQIYKPVGLMSHTNVCLAVKTLTLRQAV